MKKFIVKILLFGLPLVALAAVMESLLQNIPNNYSYKNNYLDEHAEDVQLLILGSSQSFLGIDPAYFSQNAFNAAHVSQSFDFDLKVFDKYQERTNKLKMIIIPVSYFSFWHTLKDSEEHWRIKNYVLYYRIKAAKSSNDYSELLSEKMDGNLRRLYRYYFFNKDDISVTPLGWGTMYKFDSENKNLETSGKARAAGHTYDIHSNARKKIFAENVEILNALAEACERNNIKLIFLTTPTYHTYRENLNAEQLNKMFETIDGIAQQHTITQYVNWHEDPDFTAEDFYDSDHLNGNGAKKLSVKLARYIDSLGIFSVSD